MDWLNSQEPFEGYCCHGTWPIIRGGPLMIWGRPWAKAGKKNSTATHSGKKNSTKQPRRKKKLNSTTWKKKKVHHGLYAGL